MLPRIQLILLLSILIFHTKASPAISDKDANTNAISNGNINDAILELFHNCSCYPFYQCDEANKYMVAARSNALPEKIKCETPNYTCCKVIENSSKEVPSDTEPRLNMPEVITERNSCGIPKTVVTLRTLNPETDSATTVPGEVPWIVEIFQQDDPNYPSKFKGAGSLIHPRVVLTATHTIVSAKPESLLIIANTAGIFQDVGTNPNNERMVTKIFKHENYYSGGLHNDIALLILDKEYDFSTTSLNSICLPTRNQNFNGRKCLAVGWGWDENLSQLTIPLRKVDVPIVESQQCQTLLRNTRLGSNFTLHSSFLCAGGEKEKDTCKGDGGAPLICLNDDYKFVQAGIVSWGVGCGVENQPGLYTDVAKFKAWIKTKLSKEGITMLS